MPRKKIFVDERDGKKMQDIWEFKDPQYPQYPTEKNLDLLKKNSDMRKVKIFLASFIARYGFYYWMVLHAR